jgi:uncharacterized membrane protein YcaP (DUF421 family)
LPNATTHSCLIFEIAVKKRMLAINWKTLLEPDIPVIEILVRGSLTYLAIFILLRIILRRQTAGSMGMTDVLVIVLLADASQNAMAGGYHSVTDGILLVSVIIGWSFFLDWIGFHWPFFQRLIKPPKLLLVNNGKMLKRNMRLELITEEELLTEIRKEGYQTIEEIAQAFMESDGKVSIIPKEQSK